MQSEPSARYINSVSDLLYSTDEIEFLLDDIRDLEPTNYKPEDIQDFEIAGSRTGALSAVDCAGGCECESPLGTVNSWDSHSNYRRRGDSSDLSLYSGVILYCDHTHLKTPTGFVRVLFLVTTIACLTCLCTSGTIKVGLFMLPLVGRIRFMMFVTLLGIFVTGLLLFLDISHIIVLFPFNWGKMNGYLYMGLSVLFLIGSTLIFHMIFVSEAFSWVPRWTHHQLLITGCLGYLCCFQTAILSLITTCNMHQYEPVSHDLSMNLHERYTVDTLKISPEQKQLNQTSSYKYKVSYQLVATSSKEANWIDDVQPCSSKSTDPYRA